MDAITVLRGGHREVSRLIGLLENPAADSTNRTSSGLLVDQLQHLLKVHSSIEERVFYPTMARFEEATAIVQHSYLEHDAIDSLVADLSRMESTGKAFTAKVQELSRLVSQHISNEERVLLFLAEKQCSRAELEEMGALMEELKQVRSQAATRRRG